MATPTVENDEGFVVNLTNAQYNGTTDGTRATITDTQATGTITNDDQAQVSISGTPSVTEGGNLHFTVSLDKAVDVDTVITYSTADLTATTADSDYTGQTSQTITIAAGDTSGTITCRDNCGHESRTRRNDESRTRQRRSHWPRCCH